MQFGRGVEGRGKGKGGGKEWGRGKVCEVSGYNIKIAIVCGIKRIKMMLKLTLVVKLRALLSSCWPPLLTSTVSGSM